MSKNKGILNKKYYIIISYLPTEAGASEEYDKSEMQSMAFSELYTRAQSLIRAISSCSVNGKILNSTELAELLYVAYNRDESETFELKKAALANFDALYSTAPDVLQKKSKELDKEVERRAMNQVEGQVEKYRSQYREQVEEKENSIDELANEMAKLILEENYSEKGGKEGNVEEQKKTRTRRTKQAK